MAILKAIGLAQAGDAVLVAGKGHEDYQIIGTTKRPFSDRKVVQAGPEIMITKFFSGLVKHSVGDMEICGATIDSRLVSKGNIFFAYVGAATDGNRYAQKALDQGASVVVMDNPELYELVNGNKILVKNTKTALYEMGRSKLANFEGIKVAVSGSFGKTTTKDMIKLVLSCKYKVYGTEGNNNNELGTMITACGIPAGIEVVVFEIGTNAEGEIGFLSSLIKPSIGVLTGFGHAHVGHFGSVDKVADEKLSLVNSMAAGILIAKDVFSSKVNMLATKPKVLYFGNATDADAQIVEYHLSGRTLLAKIALMGDTYNVEFPHPYLYLLDNFMAAMLLGKIMDVPMDCITEIIKGYKVSKGRGEVVTVGKLDIIDDTYNASLEAVMGALKSLSLSDRDPKYALLGGIGEIGDHEQFIYDEIYNKSMMFGNINVMLSGMAYSEFKSRANVTILPDHDATVAKLREITDGILLIKASRSFGFEKYINIIKGS